MLNMIWTQGIDLGIFLYSRAQIFKERNYAFDRGKEDKKSIRRYLRSMALARMATCNWKDMIAI
jgi:hypothetical protein